MGDTTTTTQIDSWLELKKTAIANLRAAFVEAQASLDDAGKAQVAKIKTAYNALMELDRA